MSNEFSWPAVLSDVISRKDLDTAVVSAAMREIMAGSATGAQVAALGVGLKMKGVTAAEIGAFSDTLLELCTATTQRPDSVDIVGTGGDQAGTVNISTMASVVAAAAGVPVVKHGNRAASSKSGGADVLASLGINLELPVEKVAEVFDSVGITFCFAPVFHPSFRFAAAPRKEIGVPTVFNVLGPLSNPLRPKFSIVGCAFEELGAAVAEVFAVRGLHAVVVRGADGLDEITLGGVNTAWFVADSTSTPFTFSAADFGLAQCSTEDLAGGEPDYNAEVARRVFSGESGPIADTVIANAAAALALYSGVRTPQAFISSLPQHVQTCRAALTQGKALDLLTRWAEATA